MKYITIEGNIGSGKSTIIKLLKSLNLDGYVFVDEPVDEWINSGKLQQFYEDPAKYAFEFQLFVLKASAKAIKDAFRLNPDAKCIISERSVLSGDMFVQLMIKEGYMTDEQYELYNDYFIHVTDGLKLPDEIIYVNQLPEICHQNIMRRSRDGESNITLSYLKDLHDITEEFMNTILIPVIKCHDNI